MKIIIRAMWVLGVVLAALHLRFLAGSELKAGFWAFAAFLLACYSAPFYLLTRLRFSGVGSLSKGLTMGLVVVICAFSLFLPTRRFFAGYRPDALEALGYVFVSIVESGVILLFLLLMPALDRRR